MTTIAWDGRTLAADRQLSYGTARVAVTKLRRLRDGSIAGCAGDAFEGIILLDWLDSRRPTRESLSLRDYDDSGHTRVDALVIRPDRSIWMFDTRGAGLRIEESVFAIGTGMDVAIAHMKRGETAYEAVLAAHDHDSATGKGIDTMELQPSRGRRVRR